MSHENARAFGAIVTTLWPLGHSDAETGLLVLASRITEPTANDTAMVEKLQAGLDYVLGRGQSPLGMGLRLRAWTTACMMAGALTPTIEIRINVLEEHLKEYR